MQLYNPFLALATILGLQSTAVQAAIHASNIPDGTYHVTEYQNGTQIYQPLHDASLSPIVVPADQLPRPSGLLSRTSAKFTPRSPALTKRRIDCWGYQLDASGVDRAAQGLAEGVCGNGYDLQVPATATTVWVEVVVEAVAVYYCVSLSGRKGNCDRDDVYEALRQMDSKCRLYEASWFGWPGSYELVGKAREGDSICTGGGVPF